MAVTVPELLDAPNLLAAGHLPRRNDAIEAARDAPAAVRVEGDRAHQTGMLARTSEAAGRRPFPTRGPCRPCSPEMASLPSSESETAQTLAVWPTNRLMSRRPSTSQRRTLRSAGGDDGAAAVGGEGHLVGRAVAGFERIEFAGVVRLRRRR